ncbi:MAG: gephyrin-like molybdotransferase Glp, partial [Tepidisphaeraceae bacterium]
APAQPRVAEMLLHEADGLVIAQDLRADRDYPPFDKSLMDGYAVRCAEVASVVDGAPVELALAGEIAAGQQPAGGLAEKHAMAIMTGAPLPRGADGVVPIEDVEKLDGRVRILRSAGSALAPGRFVAKRGSDVRAHDIVVTKGTRLNAAQLAAAASVGAARVSAFVPPRVAVFSTGNEIVPYDEAPAPAQIRDCNTIMLLSLLRRLGCDAYDLGIVPDDPAQIRVAIEEAADADIIFITGGMSMGEYDFVPRVLKEMAIELRITKLRIKPVKPFVFGINASSPELQYIFGLPGNPVSGFVCTVRLASRLIQRLRGDRVTERWVEGILADPLPANGPREFYQPVMLRDTRVTPLQWRGSADVYTLARANALLVRAENEPALIGGSRVRVLEVPQ